MPSLAVPCAVRPASLLALHPAGSKAVALDGGGPDSWGDGRAMLTAGPRATLAVYADGRAEVDIDEPALRNAVSVPPSKRVHWRGHDPFEHWQRFLTEMPELLGAAGDLDAAGFVTVLGYDLKHWIESLPRRHPWPSHPLLYCAFYDWTYRFDYRTLSATLHAQSEDQLVALAVPLSDGSLLRVPSSSQSWKRLRRRLHPRRYQERIRTIQRYIAAGDVYQVNFAQPFAAPAAAHGATALFERMQEVYPMPFGAYVDMGGVVVASGSPECFLIVDGDRVSTFPIKGTRGLRRNPAGLPSDPKEWAEHVMIVDLERNDLGRVCRSGSVEVANMGRVHLFPLLAHLVSEVRGRLRPDIGLPQLIAATFPGGSITGAPKIRAMQIIEELELGPRGIYTGSIGWTDLRGNSRFNLAIRTAVFADGQVTYHAGGGIVADSDPEREYDETLLKAEGMFRVMAAL